MGGNSKERTLRSSMFQFIVMFIGAFALNSCNFLILGLPFMKSVPSNFKCRSASGIEWHDCTRHDICMNNLSKNDYFPDTSDS